MDIVLLPFEKSLIIDMNGEAVSVVAFKMPLEPGNVKFGISASRKIKVHREEIYLAIKQKEQYLLQNGEDLE